MKKTFYERVIIVLLLIISAIIYILFGFSSNDINPGKNIEYQIVSENLTEAHLLKWIDENAKYNGVNWTNDSENTYIVISLGEQIKGNYDISINKVSENNNTIYVNYTVNTYNDSVRPIRAFDTKVVIKIPTEKHIRNVKGVIAKN